MPVSPIAASVGVGGMNRKPDVEIIQRLLNAVPLPKGGPNPMLDTDGLCGSKTCNAISRFQQVTFGRADGRIDPGFQTLNALLQLLQQLGLLAQILSGVPGLGPGPSPAAPNGPATVSNLRREIVKWAKLAAHGPYGDVGGGAPHGIISDLDTVIETLSWGGKRTVRRGWKNYKEVFDVAVAGWSPNHWNAPGYLDGVKVPGKRVPLAPGSSVGISWCGIFATWCWIKAGKSTKWAAGVGPMGAKKVGGNQGIQPGDMCVQYGSEVHHFLATAVNGTTVEGIHGNSTAQSILDKPVNLGTINYYFQPE